MFIISELKSKLLNSRFTNCTFEHTFKDNSYASIVAVKLYCVSAINSNRTC